MPPDDELAAAEAATPGPSVAADLPCPRTPPGSPAPAGSPACVSPERAPVLDASSADAGPCAALSGSEEA
eukprot:8525321-Alexandrium_andersonii.AAC.1